MLTNPFNSFGYGMAGVDPMTVAAIAAYYGLNPQAAGGQPVPYAGNWNDWFAQQGGPEFLLQNARAGLEGIPPNEGIMTGFNRMKQLGIPEAPTLPGTPEFGESIGLTRGAIAETPEQARARQTLMGATGQFGASALRPAAERTLINAMNYAPRAGLPPEVQMLRDQSRAELNEREQRALDLISANWARRFGGGKPFDTGLSSVAARQFAPWELSLNTETMRQNAAWRAEQRARQERAAGAAPGFDVGYLGGNLSAAGGLLNAAQQRYLQQMGGAGQLQNLGQLGYQNRLGRAQTGFGNRMTGFGAGRGLAQDIFGMGQADADRSLRGAGLGLQAAGMVMPGRYPLYQAPANIGALYGGGGSPISAPGISWPDYQTASAGAFGPQGPAGPWGGMGGLGNGTGEVYQVPDYQGPPDFSPDFNPLTGMYAPPRVEASYGPMTGTGTEQTPLSSVLPDGSPNPIWPGGTVSSPSDVPAASLGLPSDYGSNAPRYAPIMWGGGEAGSAQVAQVPTTFDDWWNRLDRENRTPQYYQAGMAMFGAPNAQTWQAPSIQGDPMTATASDINAIQLGYGDRQIGDYQGNAISGFQQAAIDEWTRNNPGKPIDVNWANNYIQQQGGTALLSGSPMGGFTFTGSATPLSGGGYGRVLSPTDSSYWPKPPTPDYAPPPASDASGAETNAINTDALNWERFGDERQRENYLGGLGENFGGNTGNYLWSGGMGGGGLADTSFAGMTAGSSQPSDWGSWGGWGGFGGGDYSASGYGGYPYRRRRPISGSMFGSSWGAPAQSMTSDLMAA